MEGRRGGIVQQNCGRYDKRIECSGGRSDTRVWRKSCDSWAVAVGSSFAELAVSFENAAADEERSRITEQGVSCFTRPHGIDDWLRILNDMPAAELYRLLEANCLLTRELLSDTCEAPPLFSGRTLFQAHTWSCKGRSFMGRRTVSPSPTFNCCPVT